MLLGLLRTHLRPYTRTLVSVVLLQLVGTIASLYLPSLNADIIDRGIARGDTGYILSTGGWMLLVTLLQIACSVTAVYLVARTAMSFGRDVRAALFHQVGRLSSREVALFGAPSLITRNTNDVQQVQMLVMLTFSMMVAAPITMIGAVVMALREDAGLSWLLLVSLPLLAVCVGLVVRRMVPGYRQLQAQIDGVNRVLREQISGIRVVRAFVREPAETRRFTQANTDLTATSLRVGKLMVIIPPAVMVILNASSVAVLWFGAARIESGAVQIGALTAFLNYLTQVLMSAMIATVVVIMVPRAAVCAERICAVLHTESSVVPPAEPVRELTGPVGVELRDVGFRYPGAAAPVLRDVSFRAAAGSTTAIIGSTGAGKSTLVSLIPRLLDVTAGAVRLNGVDVRELDPDLLWQRIGLIPQRSYLFTGTIAGNLRYGRPDATDDELWEALEIAQAREFVERSPDGLASPVAQGGTDFSGGERQRLAIARAVVRRPDVYLFDDSFSALDPGTDARLRAALAPVTADAAVVIVAQRVSTVMDADQILVLDDGAVVGRGRHGQLLETCPIYADIVESQLAVGAAA